MSVAWAVTAAYELQAVSIFGATVGVPYFRVYDRVQCWC